MPVQMQFPVAPPGTPEPEKCYSATPALRTDLGQPFVDMSDIINETPNTGLNFNDYINDTVKMSSLQRCDSPASYYMRCCFPLHIHGCRWNIIYGMPNKFSIYNLICYNTELWEEAGYDEFPSSFEEMLSADEKIYWHSSIAAWSSASFPGSSSLELTPTAAPQALINVPSAPPAGGTRTTLVFSQTSGELWEEAGYDEFPSSFEEMLSADEKFNEMGIDTISLGNTAKWFAVSYFTDALAYNYCGEDITKCRTAGNTLRRLLTVLMYNGQRHRFMHFCILCTAFLLFCRI